jgi:SAM-dependent methyltransferase
VSIGKRVYEDYKAAGHGAGYLPLEEGGRVLEVGFGAGTLMEALRDKGCEVHGVDASRGLVASMRERGWDTVHHLDISEEPLPFPDDHFDAVYSYEVFEHLTNPHRMFYEVRRVLKAGRRFYFSTPAQEVAMGYGPGRHAFVYPGLLERAGLERFIMQMYFAVEKWFEPEFKDVFLGRNLILVNRKDVEKPDIVEVIAGDYHVADLFGAFLGTDTLRAEMEREARGYLHLFKLHIVDRNWDYVPEMLTALTKSFPLGWDFYITVADYCFEGGNRAMARDILRQVAEAEAAPPEVRAEAQERAEAMRPGPGPSSSGA